MNLTRKPKGFLTGMPAKAAVVAALVFGLMVTGCDFGDDDDADDGKHSATELLKSIDLATAGWDEWSTWYVNNAVYLRDNNTEIQNFVKYLDSHWSELTPGGKARVDGIYTDLGQISPMPVKTYAANNQAVKIQTGGWSNYVHTAWTGIGELAPLWLSYYYWDQMTRVDVNHLAGSFSADGKLTLDLQALGTNFDSGSFTPALGLRKTGSDPNQAYPQPDDYELFVRWYTTIPNVGAVKGWNFLYSQMGANGNTEWISVDEPWNNGYEWVLFNEPQPTPNSIDNTVWKAPNGYAGLDLYYTFVGSGNSGSVYESYRLPDEVPTVTTQQGAYTYAKPTITGPDFGTATLSGQSFTHAGNGFQQASLYPPSAPSASVAGNSFTFTSLGTGEYIYYTLNGDLPRVNGDENGGTAGTNTTKYDGSAAITLTSGQTIKAIKVTESQPLPSAVFTRTFE
jgi:hypothetical protein